MLWIKNLNCHKIGFYISSLVFVLGLFFSVFFATDTFAVSDISFTLNYPGSITSDTDIFSDCFDSSCLSQYSYLIISFSSNDVLNSPIPIGIKTSSYQVPKQYFISSPAVISLPSNIEYLRFYGSSIYRYCTSTCSIGGNYVFTLTNSYPGSVSPSGTLNITQNGTYDVSSYATAEVDVPPVMGDYHDDFQQGITAIYVLGGVMLVIYFFYCIYRMIIKNVGGD